MQEKRARKRRWLLPFTHNLDLAAIDAALQLADAGGATLVAVSLIATLRTPCVRLELIQQSKDFLEATRSKALRFDVALECYEEYAPDVLARLTELTNDLNCNGLILATRGNEVSLLQGQELEQLLTHPPAALVLVRLPARTRGGMHMAVSRRIRSWWQRRNERPKAFFVHTFRLLCRKAPFS